MMDAFILLVVVLVFVFFACVALWAGFMWRFERKYSYVARKAFHTSIAASIASCVALVLLVLGVPSVVVLGGLILSVPAIHLGYRKIACRA